MSAGLTDAERAMLLDGQEHTVEAGCWSASCAGSLPWAVARIKADAIAAARAEERAKYKPLVHAARTIALMLDHYAQESTR